MRLLTWNLDVGRARNDWPVLQSLLGADLVLLQESSPLDPSAHRRWTHAPGRTWGSAIVVGDGHLEPVDVAGYTGWVTGAQWHRSDGTRPFVFSVHTPGRDPSGKPTSYIRTTGAIMDAILDRVGADSDVIVGGDFNVSVGTRTDAETMQTTSAERAALARFRGRGLVAAWQAAHPDEPLPQTLRWKKNRAAPYHCDGFFLRPHVAERTFCEVLHSPLLHAKSDHYPVVAWILDARP